MNANSPATHTHNSALGTRNPQPALATAAASLVLVDATLSFTAADPQFTPDAPAIALLVTLHFALGALVDVRVDVRVDVHVDVHGDVHGDALVDALILAVAAVAAVNLPIYLLISLPMPLPLLVRPRRPLVLLPPTCRCAS